MAVGEWLQKIINDKTLSFIGWNDATRDLFKEGCSLFYSRLLGDFRNLRDKEDDYTLVCYPSLNEGDIEHVYVQNPFAILIPADVEDTTRLGTIMEAMIADTYDNVMDPYINKAIIGKGARDEESAALFRELCEKRVYDMNYALNRRRAVQGLTQTARPPRQDAPTMRPNGAIFVPERLGQIRQTHHRHRAVVKAAQAENPPASVRFSDTRRGIFSVYRFSSSLYVAMVVFRAASNGPLKVSHVEANVPVSPVAIGSATFQHISPQL